MIELLFNWSALNDMLCYFTVSLVLADIVIIPLKLSSWRDRQRK